MNTTQPVCAACERIMRPRKNEVIVKETFDDDGDPYQVWMADLWECPDCGHQVITGFGRKPVAEHYQDGFDRWLKQVTHTVSGRLKGLH